MADDDPESDDDSPIESVVAGVVTLATLTAAFGLMAAGWDFFWIAFPIGFGGALPAAMALVKWYESESDSPDSEADPLEALKRQYVRGDIDEIEFERRVEEVLQDDSRAADDARGSAGSDTGSRTTTGGERRPTDQESPRPEPQRERE